MDRIQFFVVSLLHTPGGGGYAGRGQGQGVCVSVCVFITLDAHKSMMKNL